MISQPLGFKRLAYTIVCLTGTVLLVGVDLLNGGLDGLYIQSLFALIVGPAFLITQYWYYRYFVDEARAGPGYIVVSRDMHSIVIPVELIARVRTRNYSSDVDRCIELALNRATEFGDHLRFVPEDDWWDEWQQNETTRDLLRRMT